MCIKTYTTYEIARYCDVYPSSVIHWINDGKLKAYVTPGGHHRITRENLIEFLKRFGIPIPRELAADDRKKILIVDDDVEFARLIEQAFQRHPQTFRTEVCHTGVDALVRIGQTRPDLIVLDIVLPKMDGCHVCKILKARPETQAIKIIGMSGKKFPLAEKKLADYGIEAFYRKPLDINALPAKAAELLSVQLSPAPGAAGTDS